MKVKRTLTERLATPYQITIRHRDTLAARQTIQFTWAKLFLLAMSVCVCVFIFSFLLSKTILSQWFDPRYAQFQTQQDLLRLRLRMDSLQRDVKNKDKFITQLESIISGKAFSDTAALATVGRPRKAAVVKNSSAPRPSSADSAFRKEFERTNYSRISPYVHSLLNEIFFFTPVSGIISSPFDARSHHFGVDIVTKPNEPVKAVADGVVVIASWTQDLGYVMVIQHQSNILSVYEHNAELLKKTGDFVNAGDIISIVGNTGEQTSAPHLHFELWNNGWPLNPVELILFK